MIILFVIVFIIFIMMDSSVIYDGFRQNFTTKVIGYDFDDCLQRVDDREPIKEVMDRLFNDLSNGYKVVIITSRSANGLPEIYRFLQKHGIYDKIDVYHTGNNSSRRKSPLIKQLNVSTFYDDQDGYLQDVKINAPHVELYQTDPSSSPVIKRYY